LKSPNDVKRHDAAMLDAKPLPLMLAVDVADVGGAAIGLHPLEVDRLVFALRTSQRFLPPASVRIATTARPRAMVSILAVRLIADDRHDVQPEAFGAQRVLKGTQSVRLFTLRQCGAFSLTRHE
jgi:hypothetical protein